jgi:hypothetical protein
MNFGAQVREDAPPFQINPSFGGLGMQAPGGGHGGGYRYQPFIVSGCYSARRGLIVRLRLISCERALAAP